MRKLLFLVLAVLAIRLTVAVSAQEPVIPPISIETTSGVEIAWPQPVSEVWQVVPIFGTANVPDMAYYFIEAIALNEDLSIPTNAPWLPLTPGFSQPVVNDFLASVDTRGAEDGLYAIRLTVNTRGGQQYTDIISPIRLNNARYAIEVEFIKERYGIQTEPTPTPQPPPDMGDMTPRVAPAPPNASVNMRRCDLVDNDRCPIVDRLNQNEEGLVLAISANGSGWFQVRRPTGSVGWVSPTVVVTMGDFSRVPRVAPPPPLDPPPPPATSNIVINGLAVQGTAVCNQTFTVHVNVANTGRAASPAGSVTLQSVHIRTGTISGTGFGSYPVLPPGGNFVVVIPMTVNIFFNEEHELRAFTAGVQFNTRFILAQGDCGVAVPGPTATPIPPQPTPPPLIFDFDEGQCLLTLAEGTPHFSFPNGAQTGQVPQTNQYTALRVSRVSGELWYQFRLLTAGQQPWVRLRDVAVRTGACEMPVAEPAPL